MSGCILWTGYRDRDGYGQRKWHGRVMKAHRVAFEIANGPIPLGLTIDHLCRQRACVNPEHLEAVTIGENSRRGFQATKTHCVNGHPFDEVNTRRGRTGGRECRRCDADRQRRYQQRKMAS